MAARRGHAALANMLQSKASLAAAVASREGTSKAAGGGSKAAGAGPATLVIAPDECLLHRTCPEPIVRGRVEPPPDNVLRLRVLTDPGAHAAVGLAGALEGHAAVV